MNYESYIERMKTLFISFVCLFTVYPVMALVTLPSFISDNMVLQRDLPVKLWGKADRNEAVSVTFNGQTVSTRAGNDGVWCVQLKSMPYGGPYGMIIKGKNNTITLQNILIGDVWVCSGQSNMEWVVANAENGPEEVLHADYPAIRLLTVNWSMSDIPLQEAKTRGGWAVCNPKTVERFSAVGYFFGRALNRELDIPIGLINASCGGTNIETWTSIPMMRTQSEYARPLDMMQSPDFKDKLGNRNRPDLSDLLETEPGKLEKWYLPETDVSQWKTTSLPARWSSDGIKGLGSVWYRKEFTLTAEQVKSAATICLGIVDDWDETYLNGQRIGTTPAYSVNRQYPVCPDGLHEGKNVLVVKVVNWGGDGGMYDDADRMFCRTNDAHITLTGEWRYRISTMIDVLDNISPNDFPSLLYNSMIAPLTNFPIKGTIWYQGESNVVEGYKYRTLFANLINDWRSAWNQGDFPFYFVQLADYGDPVSQPSESEWAECRESQHLALQLPNTGEAVIFDIGNPYDIHPRNKQDVGYRLALNALARTYGKNIVYSGPVYRSMQIEGNRIILRFTNTGSGMIAKGKYGYLTGFSIAGDDRKFVWAKAAIEGDRVIVYSDEVIKPVAVRYGWADNPDDANLFNKEGLPASPFRTDDWNLPENRRK